MNSENKLTIIGAEYIFYSSYQKIRIRLIQKQHKKTEMLSNIEIMTRYRKIRRYRKIAKLFLKGYFPFTLFNNQTHIN